MNPVATTVPPLAPGTVRVTFSARALDDEAHTPVSSPWGVIETWDVDPESVDDVVADAEASLAGDARLGNAVVYLAVTDAESMTVRAPRAWMVEGGFVRELRNMQGAHLRGVHHTLWMLGTRDVGEVMPWFATIAAYVDIARERRAPESIRAEGDDVALALWVERVKLRGRIDNLACLGGGAPTKFEGGRPVVDGGSVLGRLVRARMRACGCLPGPARLPARPCTCEAPLTTREVEEAAAAEGLPAYARAVFDGLMDAEDSLSLSEPLQVLTKLCRDRSKTVAVAAVSRIAAAVHAFPYTVLVRALAYLHRANVDAATPR